MKSSRAAAGSMRAVADLAVHHQRHPVQRHLLQRDRPAPLLLPVRLAVAAPDQVPGQRLHPLGLDAGHGARPQPGRLHQLGGHDPVRRLPGQAGPGEDREPRVARAEVLGPRPPATARVAGSWRLGLHPDLREQSSQQGNVHPGPFGRRRTDRHPEIAGQPLQLPLEVLPLADAQVVQEVARGTCGGRPRRRARAAARSGTPTGSGRRRSPSPGRRTGGACRRPAAARRRAARAGPGWTAPTR